MKTGVASIILTALAGSALAIPGIVEKVERAASAALFSAESLRASSSPNAVSMEELKARKMLQHQEDQDQGAFDLDRYEARLAGTPCVNGKAGEYSCNNVDLMGFLRHQDMGSRTRVGNDVWGWTSATGREFGIVGQTDGSAFVEVLSDGTLKYVGRLDTQTVSSSWRDMKVIGDHVYIGSEASNHGLQIFDLKKLLTVTSPKVFSISSDLTAHFSGFGSSHNIVANEDTNMIYAVGTSRSAKCRGGLWMVDVANPASPKDAGCVAEDGYVHDAQCVIYKGPMTQYNGREICFNYNEDSLTIVDVTNRSRPVQLSTTPYNGATYTHQGWLATDDMRYLLLDDELDEQERTGPAADQRTTTYIVDVSNLAKPVFTGVYKSPAKSIDHNQYVINGLSYQSNYGSGLRIVDVSSVARDPTGAGFKEAGFFDVRPEDDSVGGRATFNGAWSVYPYFKSGYLLVNSIERGIFSVKYRG
ncbi:hypothetical protein PspLS_06408 [Pyricularia sp. CBS 133598]|nr:hypothetical protein PspLS_06408 [Pyricularia sp. CBS 133598]